MRTRAPFRPYPLDTLLQNLIGKTLRKLLRPTGFVDSPFGHDGKVAQLAGGLNWFASVEILTVEDGRRVAAELLPVEGVEAHFDGALAAQWQALTSPRSPNCN